MVDVSDQGSVDLFQGVHELLKMYSLPREGKAWGKGDSIAFTRFSKNEPKKVKNKLII